MTSSRARQIENTAFHEAGHAVAAWFQRVRLKHATIVPDAGNLGSVAHDNPLRGIRLDIGRSPRGRDKAERLIRVCMAGPLAERRHAPACRWRVGGAADFDTVASLLLALGSIGDHSRLYSAMLRLETQAIIDDSHAWAPIERVAAALIERRSLTGEEIAWIILPPVAVAIVRGEDGIDRVAIPNRATMPA